jgi:hypothetical protein
MKYKHIVIGALLGAAAYMAYQYEKQKPSFAGSANAGPLGVPFGNLIGGGLDPAFYVSLVAGGLLGKVFG